MHIQIGSEDTLADPSYNRCSVFQSQESCAGQGSHSANDTSPQSKDGQDRVNDAPAGPMVNHNDEDHRDDGRSPATTSPPSIQGRFSYMD